MLSKWPRILMPFLALLFLAVAITANRKLDETYFGEPPVSYVLPKPELVRLMTIGYDKAIGGLLFIKMLGTITWKREPPEYSLWLYNTSRIINYLDPTFFGPYQLAAYALHDQGTDGEDLAIDVMSRASTQYKGWEAPLAVAMIYFIDKKDKVKSAEWLGRAARCPDAPPQAARFAAGLLNETDPHAALELFLEAYCIAPIPQRKAQHLKDFIAYYNQSILSSDEKKKYLEEFVSRMESPQCAPPDGTGMSWITDELRAEIREFLTP